MARAPRRIKEVNLPYVDGSVCMPVSLRYIGTRTGSTPWLDSGDGVVLPSASARSRNEHEKVSR